MARPTGRWDDAPAIDIDIHVTRAPLSIVGELGELLERCASVSQQDDRGGPRVASWDLVGESLTIVLTAEVVAATVEDALVIHTLAGGGREGWRRHAVTNVTVTGTAAGTHPTISLTVPPPSEDLVTRVVLSGTGATPLVGLVDAVPVPLAGVVGGPPGSIECGQDVVIVLHRS